MSDKAKKLIENICPACGYEDGMSDTYAEPSDDMVPLESPEVELDYFGQSPDDVEDIPEDPFVDYGDDDYYGDDEYYFEPEDDDPMMTEPEIW